MARKKMPMRKDKRAFKRQAALTHVTNAHPRPVRGGVRF